MWTLWRIFDRLEDGTGELPDGTPIERLIPLKDRPCPPEKDSLHPGYPNFINGEPGERPLQPPLGILDKDGNNIIFPTTLEKANFVPKFVPGALYSETCPCKCPEDVRVFELAVVQAKITYNRYGWNDPQGRFFVLKEEIERHGTLENYLEKVNSGKIRPKPLVIRANAGEWIEVTLHNMFDKPVLYHDYPSVPLDMPHRPSDRVSLSPQFLKHCPVCSAGVNVGYNKPEQTVAPGECIKYLWYADKEYGTCMLNPFGDLRNHRYHGLFGAIIIEPPASQYYSNFGIRKENFSEQAVITAPGVKTFREFVLFAQNGIRLLDSKGNLIKTAQQTEESGHGEVDHEDTGEKGYNYRSERFFNRLKRVVKYSVQNLTETLQHRFYRHIQESVLLSVILCRQINREISALYCTVITGLHNLMTRFQHVFPYRVQSVSEVFTTLSLKTVHLNTREIICIVQVRLNGTLNQECGEFSV